MKKYLSILLLLVAFSCEQKKTSDRVVIEKPAPQQEQPAPIPTPDPEPIPAPILEPVDSTEVVDVKEDEVAEDIPVYEAPAPPKVEIPQRVPQVPVKKPPVSIMLNQNYLDQQLTKANTGIYKRAKDAAIAAAEKAYKTPITYIGNTQKVLPISNSKNDFYDQGVYWWPNPKTKNGLPYIRIDGKANPYGKNKIGDITKLQSLMTNIPKLAIGYRLTGNEKYAQKAIEWLTVFFLDKDKYMKPNLNYAAVLPGHNGNKGQPQGVVVSHKLVHVVDVVSFLQDSKHYTPEFDKGLRAWFGEFSNWLLKSPLGIKGGQVQRNNIGTDYEVQVVAFKLFAGETDFVKKRFENEIKARLREQFTARGEAPMEESRNHPFMYYCKNLQGWFVLARMARKVDSDLWTYEAEGKSLEKAINYILPIAMGEKPRPAKWSKAEKSLKIHYLFVPARLGTVVFTKNPSTVKLCQRFLAKHDTEFRKGNDAELLLTPCNCL